MLFSPWCVSSNVLDQASFRGFWFVDQLEPLIQPFWYPTSAMLWKLTRDVRALHCCNIPPTRRWGNIPKTFMETLPGTAICGRRLPINGVKREEMDKVPKKSEWRHKTWSAAEPRWIEVRNDGWVEVKVVGWGVRGFFICCCCVLCCGAWYSYLHILTVQQTESIPQRQSRSSPLESSRRCHCSFFVCCVAPLPRIIHASCPYHLHAARWPWRAICWRLS